MVKSKWVQRARTDPDTRQLVQLFVAYKPAIDLFLAHPDVLMMDCSYKSNIYKMPLLHFLGVSPTSHFSIAFTFMPNEVYDSYEWATDAFEELILSQSNYEPEVILTDNEDAIKAAAEHT
jgi:hypothetical protein